MASTNKNRKRKRRDAPKHEDVERDSDTEVSFNIKRPRKGSLKLVTLEQPSSSKSSFDSGFTSGNSECSGNSCGSTSIKDVAIYYAKKSPAKQTKAPLPKVQSENIQPMLNFKTDETHPYILDKAKVFFHKQNQENIYDSTSGTLKLPQKRCKPSSDTITPLQKRKNIKGLILDVETAAKRRKVENNIEMGNAGKLVTPRRSPNGYLLPLPVPVGIILTDLRRRQWKIGKSIGLGGFGEIYSAELFRDPNSCESPNSNATYAPSYVVKVEPHSNGPLFVELNFYLRAAQKESIEHWKEEHELAHLGVPRAEGSGSFRMHGKNFRFLVMPRYGTDLQTLLDDSGSTLSVDTACSIGKQVIDSYEYIHSKGYVHKDCKGSNILFVNRGSTAPEITNHTPPKKICLVDYGLVSKYTQEGIHKPYGIDERCAHEGTLEYTSRDVHLGCVSRRGDVEVLLYCLIEWLGGKLPWDQPQQPHPKEIHKSKILAFQNIDDFLNKAFSEGADSSKLPPIFLKHLMGYIKQLAFEEKPDYDHIRAIIQTTPRPTKSKISHSAYSSEDEEVDLTFSIRNKNSLALPRPISPVPNLSDDTDDEVVIKSQMCEVERLATPRTRKMDEANIEQRIEQQKLARRAKKEEDELTRLSGDRFQKERETFWLKRCIKSLKNPTSYMLRQISIIESRTQKFARCVSENRDSQYRRSKPTVGAKRPRSRSLVIFGSNQDKVLATPQRNAREQGTPRTIPFKKGVQRRRGGAVKRLFNQSPAAGSNGSSFTKRFRRAREPGKVDTLSPLPTLKSISRRRHRSGPTKEVAFPVRNDNQVESLSKDTERYILSTSSKFRRSKRFGPNLQRDENTGLLSNFSTFFNKALANVTKSILRYNSKS